MKIVFEDIKNEEGGTSSIDGGRYSIAKSGQT